jgi:hypothetical protein
MKYQPTKTKTMTLTLNDTVTPLAEFTSTTHGQTLVNEALEPVHQWMGGCTQTKKSAVTHGLTKAKALLEAFIAADGHQQESGGIFYSDKIQGAAAWGYDWKALEQAHLLANMSGKIPPAAGTGAWFNAATNPGYLTTYPDTPTTLDITLI